MSFEFGIGNQGLPQQTDPNTTTDTTGGRGPPPVTFDGDLIDWTQDSNGTVLTPDVIANSTPQDAPKQNTPSGGGNNPNDGNDIGMPPPLPPSEFPDIYTPDGAPLPPTQLPSCDAVPNPAPVKLVGEGYVPEGGILPEGQNLPPRPDRPDYKPQPDSYVPGDEGYPNLPSVPNPWEDPNTVYSQPPNIVNSGYMRGTSSLPRVGIIQ